MQCSSSLLMVRPQHPLFNEETAISNTFQKQPAGLLAEEIKFRVLQEFDDFVQKLQENDIYVTVVEDKEIPPKPDAIFPNNWISFHEDGTIILYPMQATSRRLERRSDIMELLKKNFTIKQVIDFSQYETEEKFLEGTGSMVFDHANQLVYACISPRTNKLLLKELADKIEYQPIYFHATDVHGHAIYHTNVMMWIGDTLVGICSESITNEEEKLKVLSTLSSTGREIIEFNQKQIEQFAGNMLQVINQIGKSLLVMSSTAYESLNENQLNKIKSHTNILSVSIGTIEAIGGGSARCMMAEIFLPGI